jgi:ribonuclease D
MSTLGTAQVLHGDLPEELAGAFAGSQLVAWDIETSGLDWRTERIGTCQLFAQEVGVVVVSVGDSTPARMVALLEDPGVVKVFHHAPFDLRFMVHTWGARPSSIRCTKVASKLLDPEAPNDVHSLQSLALRYLGVSLTKGRVRTSDWTARLLSPEQLAYAVGDVLHLADLLAVMSKALRDAGRIDLYDACCSFLPAKVMLEAGDYPDVFAYLPSSVNSGCQRSPVKKRNPGAGDARNPASRRI